MPGSDLEERTFGFCLLLEMKIGDEWFLGLFKQASMSLNDWLASRVKPLHRSKLANAFSDNSAVSKMSLQRMTVSRQELRAATYEAVDLQSSLPKMAASRCAIRSIRFQNDQLGTIAVTTSSSRVQKSGGRSPVDSLAGLVKMVAEGVHADKKSAFLSAFAQAITVEDLPNDAKPTSILFDWGQLLENGHLELERKLPGELRETEELKKSLQTHMGDVLDVWDDGSTYRFGRKLGYTRGAFDFQKFSIKKLLRNQIVVNDVANGEKQTLSRWAKENDAYCITFSHPEYFFAAGTLYRRADFSKEVAMVRECLEVNRALRLAISEKGKPAENDTAFPRDSIFGVAESVLYRGSEWMVCTDLGDEWADYICIRDGKLLFVHCKGGKETPGASAYQEVVGQGLKNLGRAVTMPVQFALKIDQWENKRVWGQTKIQRLRGRNGRWADFKAATIQLLGSPNAQCEVHLVVTMLSVAEFDRAAAAPKPHFIQLIWLLSSFINTCREMGAKPLIICKP